MKQRSEYGKRNLLRGLEVDHHRLSKGCGSLIGEAAYRLDKCLHLSAQHHVHLSIIVIVMTNTYDNNQFSLKILLMKTYHLYNTNICFTNLTWNGMKKKISNFFSKEGIKISTSRGGKQKYRLNFQHRSEIFAEKTQQIENFFLFS